MRSRLLAFGIWAAATTAGAAETPAPGGAPPAAAPAGAADLAKLRADYDRLRDDLYRARARAALVEEGLYSSRFRATLRWKGAPDFVLRRAEIRLDAQTIWDSGEKPLVDERVEVAERPIKPGTHALTVHLEVRPGKKASRQTQDLGYASEQTFVVEVPDGLHTAVELTADDDGDLPGYEPEMDVEVESEK